MDRSKVVLVDTDDHQIGVMDKLEAHQKGALHRAFSVFIFNTSGKLLLQKRALSKYHTPGLWTNTCCSHPQPEESLELAASRRLMEEMGISTSLQKVYSFVYFIEFGNGLIEHELDHVFVGVTDNLPQPDSAEVEDYRYISVQEVMDEIEKHPEAFTYWFKKIIKESGKRLQDFL